MKKGFLLRLFAKSENAESEAAATPQKLDSTPEKSVRSGLYMKVSFATDVGRVREHNEDNFYIDGKYSHTYGKNESDHYIELSERTHIFGVFDGMGGERYGETAAALAAVQLDRIAPTLRQIQSSELPFYMNEYSRRANSAICDVMAQRNARGGCTLAVICIKDDRAYPFYLGDSRIYVCDDKGLTQITEDQTLAVRKLKAGIYTKEQAERSRDSHVLTCFLGVDNEDTGLDCQPCMPLPLKRGTKLLICTDGLTDMCSREEIEAVLCRSPQNTAAALVSRAIENGGGDNVTCVVVELEEFF